MSGTDHDRTVAGGPSELDRDLTQRSPETPPYGPDWGRFLPTPWWEGVSSSSVSRARFGAAVPGSSVIDTRIRRVSAWGQRFSSGRGGYTMARIFAVLTALASLFLIAGASAKY